MDRDTPSPEPMAYLFIHSFMYVCRSPQKEALLHMGKNIRLPSIEPPTHIRPTYNGVWHGSPKGSFMTLLLYPSAMQHPQGNYRECYQEDTNFTFVLNTYKIQYGTPQYIW
jgi:hypothetical protein